MESTLKREIDGLFNGKKCVVLTLKTPKMAVLKISEDQEDEDLKRAIELSKKSMPGSSSTIDLTDENFELPKKSNFSKVSEDEDFALAIKLSQEEGDIYESLQK